MKGYRKGHMEVARYFSDIEQIIAKGGPAPSDYMFVKNIPDMSNVSLEEEAKIHKILSPILDLKSLLGYTFHKPHGYAGDFELIERIYTKWVSNESKYSSLGRNGISCIMS